MRKAGFLLTSVAMAAGAWIFWADWPNPELEQLPWEPDAIVVLGGGDEDRITEAWRLAQKYPSIPVIVTGDGGRIVRALQERGLPAGRLLHETAARSTRENAANVRPLLADRGLRRVILVTNWFHAPRALVAFRRANPEAEFAASFTPRRTPLTPWDRNCQSRERWALPAYLLYDTVVPMYLMRTDA